MYVDYDYRLCVKLALQIMKEQRNIICNKSLEKDVMLYTGLHETKFTHRNLYFQYFLVEWLDLHWDCLQKILDSHSEFTNDQKKQITIFFAEYFVNFFENRNFSSVLSNLSIPNLLDIQKETLKELINMTEKWEEKSKELVLLKTRHKEQYEQLIKEQELQEKVVSSDL